MRLNEQRNTLVEAVEDTGCDLIGLRAAILRKVSAPYGDGSRSNMVNAETDVLPRLTAILDRLQRAMDEISGDRCHTFGTTDAESLTIPTANAATRYMVGCRWSRIGSNSMPRMLTRAQAKARCAELNRTDSEVLAGSSPYFVTTVREYAAE